MVELYLIYLASMYITTSTTCIEASSHSTTHSCRSVSFLSYYTYIICLVVVETTKSEIRSEMTLGLLLFLVCLAGRRGKKGEKLTMIHPSTFGCNAYVVGDTYLTVIAAYTYV